MVSKILSLLRSAVCAIGRILIDSLASPELAATDWLFFAVPPAGPEPITPPGPEEDCDEFVC